MNKNKPLSINNLSWSYGDSKILEQINFNIEANKFYSIIGPNGCGKTTLLKIIANILETKKKKVFIFDEDITKIKTNQLAKYVSVVPQNTNIDFEFSVMDIVMMGRTPYVNRLHKEQLEDKMIAEKAMKMTNTWHLKDKKINEISGGERQRVVVARAVTQQTDILLLDEPISHLDIQHQVDLLNMIRKLNKNNKITILAVLHDLNLAAMYSDYLILLNDKKIYAIGKPEEVITQKNIKDIYNMDVFLTKHPSNSKPYIIPKIKLL